MEASWVNGNPGKTWDDWERKEHGQIWCGTVDLGRKEDELERKDGEWFSLGLFV